MNNGVVMVIVQAGKRWSDEKIRTAFSAAGYGVNLAGRDGAHLAIRQSKPVLIIADLGDESAENLAFYRQVAALDAAPLIVIICAEDAHLSSAILDAGADDTLTQPVSPQELVARAGSILRRRAVHSLNHPAQAAPGSPPARRHPWPRWLRQLGKSLHKAATKLPANGKKG